MNYRIVSSGGLVVAAAGIAIQIAAGNLPDYPIVPPGAAILVVAAALTGFLPFRWSPIAAVVASVFLLVGLFVADQSGRLFTMVTVGDTVGLWLQLVAMAVSLVAAVLAMGKQRDTPPAPS